jgi:hypothetical protein
MGGDEWLIAILACLDAQVVRPPALHPQTFIK